MVRWLVTLGIAATATLSAWVVSGEVLERRARSHAADRWVDAELCLLGPGLSSGTRPSVRMRAIELGGEPASGWPARCEAEVTALDDALAAPPLRDQFAGMPALAPSLSSSAAVRDAALDAVWSRLREAGLPAGTPRYRGPVPTAVSARLTAEGLVPIVATGGLTRVLSPELIHDGEVWLRFDDERPRLCRIDLSSEAPSSRLGCRELPRDIDGMPQFPWSEARAPEIVLARVGGESTLVDLGSGARLFTLPARDGDAVVRASGEVTVVHAEERASEAARWRVVRLAPGRSEEEQRAEIPDGARALAWPTGLFFWSPDVADASLYFARLEGVRMAERFTVGSARGLGHALARCSTAGLFAMILARGSGAAALLGDGARVRLEELDARGQAACFGGELVWTTVRETEVVRSTCSRAGCTRRVTPRPTAETLVAAPVGERTLVVWTDVRGAVRAAFDGGQGRLADEALLFEGRGEGLEVRRFAAHGGLRRALVLLEDVRGRVLAVTIDRQGVVGPVTLGTW